MRAKHKHKASGAALVIALFMLIAVLLVGVSAAQTALQSEQAARSERDHSIALAAAEAALSDAEADIEGKASARGAAFAADGAVGFDSNCGGGPGTATQGLCLNADAASVPAWQRIDLADAGTGAKSVAYGSFTGATMPTAAGSLPACLPRYIIELMPLALAGEDASTPAQAAYRVTAIGFGMRETTQVVLQSVYRKASAYDAHAADETGGAP